MEEKKKQEQAPEKKVYERPRIVHQQSLEVVAGVCTPGPKIAIGPCQTVED